ncbi:hypothetical protein DOY81_011369 [Sarcophaga bullata]|nr:hypothetical protein DOY81_011369 [Sarcophaga bullata]
MLKSVKENLFLFSFNSMQQSLMFFSALETFNYEPEKKMFP